MKSNVFAHLGPEKDCLHESFRIIIFQTKPDFSTAQH